MNIKLTYDKQDLNKETDEQLTKCLCYWQKRCDLLTLLHMRFNNVQSLTQSLS